MRQLIVVLFVLVILPSLPGCASMDLRDAPKAMVGTILNKTGAGQLVGLETGGEIEIDLDHACLKNRKGGRVGLCNMEKTIYLP